MVLFMALYKIVLTFESVDEILNCDDSIESRILSNTFLILFIIQYKVFLKRLSLQSVTIQWCYLLCRHRRWF